MKPYPKYKDSGVEWIGQIPENWNFMILKRVTSAHKQGYYTTEDYIDEGVKLIRISDLDENGNIYYENMPYVQITENDENVYQVQINDFLFPRTGSVGLFGLVRKNVRSVFASYLINFRFNNKTYSDFLKYYFHSDSFKAGIYSSLHGGVNQNIHAGNIECQPIALPSLPEQEQIAKYLDNKTAKIDSLIEKKKRLTELLNEERTAIINQSVTKGLDPKVPMKDSGIEWLGPIPSHWELKKIKYLIKPEKNALKTGPFGSQLKGSELDPDGQFRVYNQRNVLDDDFDKGEDFINDVKFQSLKEFEILPYDILVTTRGTIGYCSMFPEDKKRGLLHPCLIRIRLNSEIMHHYWLMTYFNYSTCFKENIKLNSNATTIDVIYSYTLREVIIPTPPKNEQLSILQDLAKETNRIDSIISKSEKEIDLLQEYRTAIISEVVTGKIDVREEKI